MATVSYPPSRVFPPPGSLSVFLAGAIDMGSAPDWQQEVIDEFKDHRRLHFFNPRRTDWDSSWTQKLEDKNFNEQVNWELDMLIRANIVLINFPATASAPISLLELGFVSGFDPKKLIVCAEHGYWRRGNLEILCNRLEIKLHSDLAYAVGDIYEKLRKRNDN